MPILRDTSGSNGLFTDGDWILSRNMDPNGEYGIVQLKHIGVGEFLDKDFQFLTKAKFTELNCTEVTPGDVLISRMADPIARACIAPNLKFPYVTLVDVTILRIDENVAIPSYIKHLCNSKIIKQQVQQVNRGTTRSRITRTELGKLEIPLPPLPEQKRIAAILDKADRLRRLRRYALEVGESYLQSVFLEMFGNGDRHKVVATENLLRESPKNGLYLPAKKYGSGTPIIRINNFYNGVLNSPKTFKRVRATKKQIEDFAVAENDILVNRVNSLEYLGKCALVKGIQETTLFESNMMRLRLNTEKVNPLYFVNYLLTPEAYAQILQNAKKAVNQASINQQDIKSLLVPIPPLQLQTKFTQIVCRYEHLRTQQREALRQAESLFQSLLHDAFEGDL